MTKITLSIIIKINNMSNKQISPKGVTHLPISLSDLKKLVAKNPYAFVKTDEEIIFAEDLLSTMQKHMRDINKMPKSLQQMVKEEL